MMTMIMMMMIIMMMKGLVAHINSQHIVSRRGSEEYPCFWKVSK